MGDDDFLIVCSVWFGSVVVVYVDNVDDVCPPSLLMFVIE